MNIKSFIHRPTPVTAIKYEGSGDKVVRQKFKEFFEKWKDETKVLFWKGSTEIEEESMSIYPEGKSWNHILVFEGEWIVFYDDGLIHRMKSKDMERYYEEMAGQPGLEPGTT